MLYIGNKNLHI